MVFQTKKGMFYKLQKHKTTKSYHNGICFGTTTFETVYKFYSSNLTILFMKSFARSSVFMRFVCIYVRCCEFSDKQFSKINWCAHDLF